MAASQNPRVTVFRMGEDTLARDIERILLWSGHRSVTEMGAAQIVIMGPDTDPSFVPANRVRINNPIVDPLGIADVQVLCAPANNVSTERWFLGAVTDVGWAVVEALAEDVKSGSIAGLGHDVSIEYFNVIEGDTMRRALEHLAQAEELIARSRPADFHLREN
ncbi:MAG: hypothetical protein Q3972_08500 [Corynebacterium sp.]|nr:hypothetical protein [Corynebacterium sp.]